MSGQILYTAGGMAINAKHRRDVEPVYRTGWEPESQAEHDYSTRALAHCPACWPGQHKAEVPAPHVTRRCTGCLSIQCATCYPGLGGAR